MPKEKSTQTAKASVMPPAVEEPPVQEVVVEQSPTQPPTVAQPKKGSSKKKTLFILGCGCLFLILIALFIAGGIYFWKFLKKADKISPELQITFPTADEWYSTSSDKLTIEGLVVDESGVDKMSWTTDQNRSGTVEISEEAWSAGDIPLIEGDNKITVKAEDKKGNASEVSLNVVYNSSVLFYDLELSQDYLYQDDSAVNVRVRAGVETKEAEVNKVELYQLNEQKNQKLGEMLDNGMVENGDDIPGDSVYSGIQAFSAKESDSIELRVGVKTKEGETTYYSGIIQIKVLEKLSSEEFSAILDTNKDIDTKFAEIKKSKSGSDAAKALAEYVSTKEKIETSGISDDGYGVWWKFKDSGILVAAENNPEGTRGGETKGEEFSEITNPMGEVSDIVSSTVKFGSTAVTAAEQAKKNELEIKNTKAIYLGPYLHDFGNTDDYYDGWKTIKEAKCPKCQVTEKKDAEVTVEDFKTLSNYGLIVVVSHGDTMFKGAFGTNQGQVITYTYQQIGVTDYLKYLPDLLLNRLAMGVNGKLVVLPSFIKAYNGTFPNSLVYMGTCRSTYNFTMASAYLSKGAKAYVGFSEYVNSQYAKDVFGIAIKAFLNSNKSILDSFKEAVAAKGAQDKSAPPAKFHLRGWNQLKMGGKEIQNAGFEEGLTGWQAEGDARTISALASLKPKEGKKMAIISTGLGSVSDSNSALVQNICAKEGKATLKFQFNVVSEEPMEYVGSAYDDNFVANVYINDKLTNIVQRSINNSNWSKIGGINFAGGDDTTYMTGWADISKDLGKITKDDTIKIEFRVSDKGDSIYDTAALIDDVSLEFK